ESWDPCPGRRRPRAVHAALIRSLPAGVQRGLLPERAGGRAPAQGPHHSGRRRAGRHLQGSATHHRRRGAMDLHRPRPPDHHSPEARAGLQAPPELRSRALAGVAAVGGGGLPAYALRRLLLAVPVLFGVSVLVFAVLHLAPGDPAAIMLGAQATKEDVERLRRDLGLDPPLVVQYLHWIGQVARGDLGRSIPLGRAVLPEVLLRFKATLLLTAGALVIPTFLGLVARLVSPVEQYSWRQRPSMGVAGARGEPPPVLAGPTPRFTFSP